MLHADRALAARLEACEAATTAAFIDTHARLAPGCGAARIDVNGVRAMFDSPGSPMTQTFGLGILGPGDAATLAEIEAFYAERGSEVSHEVSPLAGVEVLGALVDRGYRPVEQGSVLMRDLATLPPAPAAFRFVVAGPEDEDRWVRCAAAGWGDDPAVAAYVAHVSRLSFASPVMRSVAALDGDTLVGTAAMAVHDGVALLAGASTPPPHRGRGVQGALLAGRLHLARELGCTVAMMGALPGSTSQRNAERSGFTVAYTRTRWSRAAGAGGPHG